MGLSASFVTVFVAFLLELPVIFVESALRVHGSKLEPMPFLCFLALGILPLAVWVVCTIRFVGTEGCCGMSLVVLGIYLPAIDLKFLSSFLGSNIEVFVSRNDSNTFSEGNLNP